jgi:hypothetical protein
MPPVQRNDTSSLGGLVGDVQLPNTFETPQITNDILTLAQVVDDQGKNWSQYLSFITYYNAIFNYSIQFPMTQVFLDVML